MAARGGRSVAVLLSTYAHCIDGDEEIRNRRVDAALGGSFHARHGTCGTDRPSGAPSSGSCFATVPWVPVDDRTRARPADRVSVQVGTGRGR
ncbi:hypothetical protein FXF69_39075 [Actinomadura chibensis]|uniref:Uncharacterized protein n=1 Tax=Actinomadura chibensis TaxID=392828 RepID=A0A5D0N986_9ACTN|nr:hypothetical protein FXF69_39075 [Actinomadura chibensis]